MTFQRSTAMIDTHNLRRIIDEQGLKLWWIAEQIKVDRKTLSRWLNGKIKWIKGENLEALANILSVDVDAITLISETDRKASEPEFRRAAELIHSQNLKAMLRNSYNWELLEYLVKASLSTDLPLHLLGSLYLDLAEACFFQNKIKESAEYVKKTQIIAKELKHELLFWDSQAIKAKIETCFGSLPRAIEIFRQCLSSKPDSIREWRALCNMSEAMRRYGDLEGAYELRRKTLADFARRKLIEVDGLSWSKAWIAFGESSAELGYFQAAMDAYDRGLAFSEAGNFPKGSHYARMLKAVAMGQLKPDRQLITVSETAHGALKLTQDDQLYYRDRALLHMALGDYDRARQLLSEAVMMARDFPIEKGLFYQVVFHIETAVGDGSAAGRARKIALSFFENAEAKLRIEQFTRPLFPPEKAKPLE